MSSPANKLDCWALTVLEDCGAYVDDAASFPEQFKPGVVKRHQRDYAKAQAAFADLISAARLARPAGEVGWTSAYILEPAHAARLRRALDALTTGAES